VLLVATTAAIVVGKAAVVCGVACLFRSTVAHAVAVGVCLAQVGEFSFVLAEVAREGKLIDVDLFKLIISATIVTLFLTPYLVAAAPRLALAVSRRAGGDGTPARRLAKPAVPEEAGMSGHVVIVGFGPAGRRVAEALLRRYKSLVVVVELSPKSAEIARSYGLRTYIADGTRGDVLEHVHVERARTVVVTVPDPTAARRVIEGVRALAPATPIVARARYHVYRWELILAGAEVVVDEEDQVGVRMAVAVRKNLRAADGGDLRTSSPPD
jgi:CPA2 family monovalent cation:H+ antiporter-2